jgi:hypothetical protein
MLKIKGAFSRHVSLDPWIQGRVQGSFESPVIIRSATYWLDPVAHEVIATVPHTLEKFRYRPLAPSVPELS